jgi:uncharacterized protein (TIGR01777 family)
VSRIAITGATGLLGRALVDRLRERGDTVVVLTRDPGRAREALGPEIEAHAWPDPISSAPPTEALAGADAVVNLLGEPISQRWSAEVKRRIRDSRVEGTRNLVVAIRTVAESERPGVLISQSATGYYGPRGEEPLDEDAAPGGDFLAEVVRAWESAALAAAELGLRVVLTRTGVVLSSSGGALEKMLPPFKAGVGGPIGGGRQYLPWVHVADVVGAILFALDRDEASGPVNVTAPEPVTNAAFSRALGTTLHRPAFAPVPAIALKLLYGEMATIVLSGQRAVPRRLQELGYQFEQPELEAALRDVLGR